VFLIDVRTKEHDRHPTVDTIHGNAGIVAIAIDLMHALSITQTRVVIE
jgi:hypothetical protein